MNEPTSPSGIMLTSHALSRHAKRLRGLLATHGVTVTTTQSQEAFARVLGMKNWHEAITLCSRITPLSLPSPSGEPSPAKVA